MIMVVLGLRVWQVYATQEDSGLYQNITLIARLFNDEIFPIYGP